jgi:hypothetical protein
VGGGGETLYYAYYIVKADLADVVCENGNWIYLFQIKSSGWIHYGSYEFSTSIRMRDFLNNRRVFNSAADGCTKEREQ